jgi:hypothetical protein
MPDMTSAAVVAPEPDFVVTGVDTELPISRDDGQSSQDSWDAVVNQLIEWANPRPLIDDGVDAPTRITLMLAGQLVGALKHADREAPARMRRDPNGGILFVPPPTNYSRLPRLG